MKRAWIFLAVLALVATFALQGGKIENCNSVAAATASEVDPESEYRNHGQYVRAAAAFLNGLEPEVSEACHDCIMAQFAQSDSNNGSCNFPSGQGKGD